MAEELKPVLSAKAKELLKRHPELMEFFKNSSYSPKELDAQLKRSCNPKNKAYNREWHQLAYEAGWVKKAPAKQTVKCPICGLPRRTAKRP
jgi:hypothetical protein